MDCKIQLEKHLCNLPCPICRRPVYFTDKSLRRHLESFHRRYDFMELEEISKKMCGIKEQPAVNRPATWKGEAEVATKVVVHKGQGGNTNRILDS